MFKPFVKLWGAVCLLAVCLLAAAPPARAQVIGTGQDSSLDLTKDWSLRVGFYILNSSTARDAAGAVTFSGLLERNVYYGRDYNVSVGIGYNGFDRIYSVPIIINAIKFQNKLRYGVGAGYSFNKRVNGSGSNGTVLNLILGYEFAGGTTPLNADLRYYFVSGTNNELDGLSVTVGYRF